MITIAVYFMNAAAPGDPTSKMMDPKMTVEEKQRLREKFDLDKSIIERYAAWVSELVLHRNLGHSTAYGQPVTKVIQLYMWNTFVLSGMALLISILIGIPAGIVSATKQYSIFDNAVTVIAFAGRSVPAFFFGLMLIKVFAIDLGWFPISGMAEPGSKDIGTWHYIKDVAYHMVLPALVLGLPGGAGYMRFTRTAMLEVIRQDYVRTARSKGLTERVVIYKHALRNALIPIITLLGFALPGLFGGAIITEKLFAWPGLGTIAFKAVTDRDYPLLMGTTLFFSILTLTGNLLADICYGLADPRIKYN
jgi:peptide/nickel transport system permease protein